MHNAIRAFLASSAYHLCLLLVHPEVCTLQEAANELVPTHGWLHLSIGQELSAALLSEPPKRRSRAARRWMESRLSEMAPGPVLCTEIDLLFEPTLNLRISVPLWQNDTVMDLRISVSLWPEVGGVAVQEGGVNGIG